MKFRSFCLAFVAISLSIVGITPVRSQTDQVGAQQAQTQTFCVIEEGKGAARFNTGTGEFVVNAVGHSQVSGIARVLSVNPLVLSFHSTEGDVRISLVEGFATVLASIAHGAIVTFGGVPVECPDTSPAPPIYFGNFDLDPQFSLCQAVYGWAADFRRPSVPITVAVYVDGVKVEDALASLHRQDVQNWLVNDWHLPDNGNHGFAVPFPVRDGRPHSISIRFEQSNVELGSSPRSATCFPLSAADAKTRYEAAVDGLMEMWRKSPEER